MKHVLQKTLALFLTLFILAACLPIPVFAADAVHITSPDELIAFTNGDPAVDAVLDRDIDLGEWTTAFTDGYSGTFDGNGHSITYTKTNPAGNFHSLFKSLNAGGEIKDLTVKGSMTFTAARTYNAPFVYENHGTIRDCVNEMTITHTGTKNCQYAAGITAKNYGTVTGCVNNAAITVRNYAGGIVAQNLGGNVTDCVNNGSVTASNAAGYAGGIVAAVGAASSDDVNLIENCVNKGNVTGGSGDYGFAGGMIAQINIASSYATYQTKPAVTLKGCTSTGTLSAGGGTDENVAKNNNPDNCTLTIEAGAPVHEHTYDEGVITKEATCVEPGVRTYTCSSCDEGTDGHTRTEIIPATGVHTPGEWTAETIDGEELLVKRCTVCNNVTAKKSAAAAATLDNAVQALTDSFFRLNPVYGRDTNVCDMLSDTLSGLGYEDIAVTVAAVENPADGTAAIAENGDISYFFADPSGSRFMWFASIPVTFKLTLEDADATYEKNAVVRWDADQARQAMTDQIVSRVTEETIRGANGSLAEVTDDLVLYKAVKDDNGEDLLWSLITWESSDPETISIDASAQNSADTLFVPYRGVVRRAVEDRQVTLTATFRFQRTAYDEAEITCTRSFDVTVKGMGDELLAEMQRQLDDNYIAEKLTYMGSGEAVDPGHVTYDVQLLLPRTSGIDNSGDYTFSVISDNEAAQVNHARLNVFRPMPGMPAETVTLTVTMKHRNYDLSVSKDITLTIEPLTEEEIAERAGFMEQVKASLFEGINNGANEGPDAVTADLSSFMEAVPDGEGGIRWIRVYSETTDTGVAAVSIDPAHPSEKWDKFRSSVPTVISHETLFVTPAKENTEVTLTVCLSDARLARYAELYPENEELAGLSRQTVQLTLTVPGTDPAPESPAEDEPVDGAGCVYCGKVHGDGILDRIVLMFHGFLAYFRAFIKLFG